MLVQPWLHCQNLWQRGLHHGSDCQRLTETRPQVRSQRKKQQDYFVLHLPCVQPRCYGGSWGSARSVWLPAHRWTLWRNPGRSWCLLSSPPTSSLGLCCRNPASPCRSCNRPGCPVCRRLWWHGPPPQRWWRRWMLPLCCLAEQERGLHVKTVISFFKWKILHHKIGLTINMMCAFITISLTCDSRAALFLKPDLETVPPVNQNGRCRYSQQSFMTNRVVRKEELLILLAAVMFWVHL